MKLRCKTCGGQLGLTHHTTIQWNGRWWKKYRFDTKKCLDEYLRKRAEDLERKVGVQQLFKAP